MLEHNKKIILQSFVLAFVSCYVINNCYVGIEMLKISRDRFGKSFGTKSFVLAFVSCYVINNCCVGVEMLKIHRDWFGKSLTTVAFIGNIAVTVPHPCLILVDILFNSNKIYLRKLRTF